MITHVFVYFINILQIKLSHGHGERLRNSKSNYLVEMAIPLFEKLKYRTYH